MSSRRSSYARVPQANHRLQHPSTPLSSIASSSTPPRPSASPSLNAPAAARAAAAASAPAAAEAAFPSFRVPSSRRSAGLIVLRAFRSFCAALCTSSSRPRSLRSRRRRARPPAKGMTRRATSACCAQQCLCSRGLHQRASLTTLRFAMALCWFEKIVLSPPPHPHTQGRTVLLELLAEHAALPASVAADVFILELPMQCAAENALIVNAIQRASLVIAQVCWGKGGWGVSQMFVFRGVQPGATWVDGASRAPAAA